MIDPAGRPYAAMSDDGLVSAYGESDADSFKAMELAEEIGQRGLGV